MRATFIREFEEYFHTMLGYVFVSAFLFLAGVFFSVNNINTLDAQFHTTLNDCIYVFLITSPLLTMKLLSEEKKTKREQLLMTVCTPFSSIMIGKFLAALAVFAVTLCCTVVYPVILCIYGSAQSALIVNGYIGFFFLGMAFIAVGMFASSITESQLTSAICTYGILLLFLCLDLVISRIHVKAAASFLLWFSVFERFKQYQYGTFGIASVVYYVVFSLVFLSLGIAVMRYRRRGISNLIAAGYLVLIIGCAVVCTLAVEKLESQFHLRWDLTDTQVYSIGSTTKDVLQGLDKDVTVYTLYPSGEEDRTVQEILRRYEEESPHIAVVNIDPVESPFFTQQYEPDDEKIENSSLIIRENGGEEFRVISARELYEWQLDEDQLYAVGMVAEQRITAAISSIEGGRQTRAYFVTGHGEMDVREEYYLADTLESDGYKVETYHLIYNDMELDSKDCLLFLSPLKDLTDEEYKVMQTFAERGGRAVYLINPLAGDLPNFNRLFDAWGLELKDDLIVEPDSENYLNSQIMVRPRMEEEHPALASVAESGAGLILPRCRGILVTEQEGIETEPFLYSSAQSYGKVDPYTETLEKEEGDTDGPFILGVSAVNRNSGARMLLLGNSDFVSTIDNAKFEGNIALFMDSVAWASEKPESVVIKPKSLVSAPLKIPSTKAGYRLMFLVIAVMPAVLLIYGTFVWRRRLRR